MKIEPFSWMEKYVPLYRYSTYNGIYNILKESLVNDELYKGYKGWDAEWDGTSFEEISEISFNVDNRTLEMFNSFLSECNTEGIKVVFCYAPIYSGVWDKMSNAQEMNNMYQGIADCYDIPIMDYTESFPCGDTTYFYNAMHLNKRGAERFTRQLASDLEKYEL